ncbi:MULTISPECIES: TetR/AcrR family transcriptional regulator [unclassified Mycobacterium]|uniref:TetR/AcrR family transcriptional regulator n=1 Tax=unclassified Mycobacterium TaxID=2642494 RepID=UPI0029C70FFD|nr:MULTISPECIES: TetR/AcrR family transcriptional regulator [unclassified Mycobacterium]
MNRTDRRKQEIRDRILQAAFELFLSQGIDATKIEDICERADVANRTFFNHFATRQEMIQALAEKRLLNLREVVLDRSAEPVPSRLTGVFGDIAAALVEAGDTYRAMIGAMLVTTVGSGTQRGFGLHDAFLELVKDGVAKGEISSKHDPQILADLLVGGLVVGIVNWTIDTTYSLETGLRDSAAALVELLAAEPPPPKSARRRVR